VAYKGHIRGICQVDTQHQMECGEWVMPPPQCLQHRFEVSPRSDVCQRFRQGIWKIKKVCLLR